MSQGELIKVRLKSLNYQDGDGDPLYWNTLFGWCPAESATFFHVEDLSEITMLRHMSSGDLPFPSMASYVVEVIET